MAGSPIDVAEVPTAEMRRKRPMRPSSVASARSLQFCDAKRFERVDLVSALPVIVEPEEADRDAVSREVSKDETVLLDRLQVFLHLQMRWRRRPNAAER